MTDTTTTTPADLARVLSGPEVRSFAFAPALRDVEASASGRYLEGIAVPYGEWADIGGWFREQFRAGAFAKSIRESAARLPLLLFHDARTFPIGVAEEWREEPHGLRGVWKIDDRDARAVQAHQKAADGFLSGMSVGFQPIENLARDERGKLITDKHGDPVDLANVVEFDELTGQLSVTRVEARLLETSLTPTPAYVGAGVTLVRSAMVPAGATRRPGRRAAEVRRWADEIRDRWGESPR